MANTYDTGDVVDIDTSTVFQDADGTAFDPQVVTFKVVDPDSTSTDYVNGVDSEVTKNATGDYTCSIEVATAGYWYYRIAGTQNDASLRGADEGRFYVRESRV